MIKIQVTSEDYSWSQVFDDDAAARAFLDSNSLWVEQVDADTDVLRARFRFDGNEILTEYLIAQGMPGELYIIMVWGYTTRRGLQYQVLEQVICRQIAPAARKVRKRARRA